MRLPLPPVDSSRPAQAALAEIDLGQPPVLLLIHQRCCWTTVVVAALRGMQALQIVLARRTLRRRGMQGGPLEPRLQLTHGRQNHEAQVTASQDSLGVVERLAAFVPAQPRCSEALPLR